MSLPYAHAQPEKPPDTEPPSTMSSTGALALSPPTPVPPSDTGTSHQQHPHPTASSRHLCPAPRCRQNHYSHHLPIHSSPLLGSPWPSLKPRGRASPKPASTQGPHSPGGWWSKPGAMLRRRECTEDSEGRGLSTSPVLRARRRGLQQNVSKTRRFPEPSPRWRAAK